LKHKIKFDLFYIKNGNKIREGEEAEVEQVKVYIIAKGLNTKSSSMENKKKGLRTQTLR